MKSMRTLSLMRHAKSDWEHPGLSDHDRPLNRRGQRAVPRMADWMEATIGVPDMILASSAARVQQTTQGLVDGWADSPLVCTLESLYLATPDSIMKTIQSDGLESQHLLVIGHNPGMQLLACDLSRQPLEFPTAAVAVFQVDIRSWSDRFGPEQSTLVGYMRPKLLDDA